jgi:hypothetical protein
MTSLYQITVWANQDGIIKRGNDYFSALYPYEKGSLTALIPY